MKSGLKTLIESANSSLPDEQEEAVFQLAMLLEKNTRPSNEAGFYESVLAPDLLELKLDKGQQKEILGRFLSVTKLPQLLPSFLWAIGKGSPEIGLPLLLDFVRENPDLPSPEARYQAVIALESLLGNGGKGGKSSSVIQRAQKDAHLLGFLRQAASADDPRLMEPAQRLLKRLRKGA